jgi:hypothetical protein
MWSRTKSVFRIWWRSGSGNIIRHPRWHRSWGYDNLWFRGSTNFGSRYTRANDMRFLPGGRNRSSQGLGLRWRTIRRATGLGSILFRWELWRSIIALRRLKHISKTFKNLSRRFPRGSRNLRRRFGIMTWRKIPRRYWGRNWIHGHLPIPVIRKLDSGRCGVPSSI